MVIKIVDLQSESGGRFVYTANSQRALWQKWEVDFQDFVNYMCTRVFRDLTPDERSTYNVTDPTPVCSRFGNLAREWTSDSSFCYGADFGIHPNPLVAPTEGSFVTLPVLTCRLPVYRYGLPDPVISRRVVMAMRSDLLVETSLISSWRPSFRILTMLRATTGIMGTCSEGTAMVHSTPCG